MNNKLMKTEEEVRQRAKELLQLRPEDLITQYMFQEQEIERLNNIIKETSEDLHQVVKWCTENKHNEDTIERYLVVDYGTIVGKINEIRTKLDKGE